jgi:hypothetical protein
MTSAYSDMFRASQVPESGRPPKLAAPAKQRARTGNLNNQDDAGDNKEPGREDNSSGDELVENIPPGPDTEVIKKSSREDTERSWFLGVFLGLLALTLIADLAGSAWLSTHAWTQVKPEITTIRTFLFQVTGVIIGYFYGSTSRRYRN